MGLEIGKNDELVELQRALQMVKTRRIEILSLTGEIFSDTAPALDNILTELEDGGCFGFIIDMRGVTEMSSAGINVLLRHRKKCIPFFRGGELVLYRTPDDIASTLDMACFGNDILPRFADLPRNRE